MTHTGSTPGQSLIRSLSTATTALIAATFLAIAGCKGPQASAKVTVGTQADPHAEFVDSLRDEARKASEIGACRRIVDQLNSYLPQATAERKPAALTTAERVTLEKDLRLQPDEVAEVARAEFTTLDAYYLDEAILMRDIARALEVGQLPPAERATAAMRWVARNLRLAEATGPAAPIAFTVNRGTASALERTYVLYALLQNLNLDVALIGDASAGPDSIWAVGVLVDGQVLLFDARLGLPLPSPDGKGILTFAQARSAAEPFKALNFDPQHSYDVTADRAKKAAVLIAPSLSSLSPRIRYLQSLLPEGSIRLVSDPKAVLEKFGKAMAPDGAPAVVLWCPPNPDSLPRLLYAFLPPSEGGGDRSPPEAQRRSRYAFARIPFNILPPFLRQLQGEPGRRVLAEFEGRSMLLSYPGQARDMILRGRFREAAEQLEGIRAYAERRPPSAQDLEAGTREWANAASAYYAELARRDKGRGDFSSGINFDELRTQTENGWKSNHGTQAFIAYLVAESLAAEATYLLGQCKHEEAERLALNSETAANSKPAWSSAQRWWQSFIIQYPNVRPTAYAKLNLARVLEASGQRDQAREAYEALATSDLMPIERLACKYQAAQLK